MRFLANASAIIIDLRENQGGSTDILPFLCRYFLDYPTQLTSNYIREADFLQESWISKEIEEKPLTTVPLFLLTSQRTFKSATAYDSLAYAYFSRGKRAAAIECFKKVLEPDPDNRNAKKMIQRLESER